MRMWRVAMRIMPVRVVAVRVVVVRLVHMRRVPVRVVVMWRVAMRRMPVRIVRVGVVVGLMHVRRMGMRRMPMRVVRMRRWEIIIWIHLGRRVSMAHRYVAVIGIMPVMAGHGVAAPMVHLHL